jgi:hypothetical protein
VKAAAAVFAFLGFVGPGLLASDQPLKVGARLQSFVLRAKSDKRHICMTQPAQMDPCVEARIAGINYTIAYGEKTGRITYVFTSDKAFRTTDGVRVGETVDLSEEQILAWPGWEIRGPETPDRWYPLLGILEVTVVTDGNDALVRAERNEELMKQVFANNRTVTFRILGFVRSKD